VEKHDSLPMAGELAKIWTAQGFRSNNSRNVGP
jgi:hypothetical protein